MEVGQRPRQVVDRREAQVLDGAGGRLDRRGRQRRLVMRRKDRAMDARRLGRPQQRSDVLRVLERVEHEHERRLRPLARERQDVVGRGPRARAYHQRDALVAIEPGDRRQRPALDLDHGDPQARRVEHELLERMAALRDDEQAARLAAGHESLLDRAPAGDDLLVLGQRQREREGLGRPRRRPGAAVVPRVGPGGRRNARSTGRSCGRSGRPGRAGAVGAGSRRA